MKKMKFMAFVAATFLTVSSVVYFNSCKKDACKDVICNNGGVCADGNCTCTTGYEGSDCSTDIMKQVKGTFVANDVVNGNSQSAYNSIITGTSGLTTVTISNIAPYYFGGSNVSVSGTIDYSAKTISFPDSDPAGTGNKIRGTASYTISASGVVSITWAFTFTSSSGSTLAGTGAWSK